MTNKIILSLNLIMGVILVVAILLISLDSELETIENQDRDYQEHIQLESK